jgi:hypothetical protein
MPTLVSRRDVEAILLLAAVCYHVCLQRVAAELAAPDSASHVSQGGAAVVSTARSLKRHAAGRAVLPVHIR